MFLHKYQGYTYTDIGIGIGAYTQGLNHGMTNSV